MGFTADASAQPWGPWQLRKVDKEPCSVASMVCTAQICIVQVYMCIHDVTTVAPERSSHTGRQAMPEGAGSMEPCFPLSLSGPASAILLLMTIPPVVLLSLYDGGGI